MNSCRISTKIARILIDTPVYSGITDALMLDNPPYPLVLCQFVGTTKLDYECMRCKNE